MPIVSLPVRNARGFWPEEDCQIWLHLLGREPASNRLPEPEWFDRPAIGRITVSTPSLYKPFARLNTSPDGDKLPYAHRVKPFNFMLTTYLDAPWKAPTDAKDWKQFQLVAPWEPNPSRWTDLDWIDRHHPSTGPFRLATDLNTGAPGVMAASSYRNVAGRYSQHPEDKSTPPPGSNDEQGLLDYKAVHLARHVHIGKETNSLEEGPESIADTDSILEYTDPDSEAFREFIEPLVDEFGTRQVAKASNLHPSTVSRLTRGETEPRRTTRQAVVEGLARLVRARLRDERRPIPRDPLALLITYKDRS